MKKIFLFISLITICSIVSFGNKIDEEKQVNYNTNKEVAFGVKFGTNYSNVYSIDGLKFISYPKFGLAGGIFLGIPINQYFGIQPELLFSQKGYMAEGILFGSKYIITRTSNYIDIPLLLVINPAEYFSFVVGPQYSYLLSQKNKFENAQTSIEQEKEFDDESTRPSMFGFTGGFDTHFSAIILGGRVGWDFLKNNTDEETATPRYKNKWFQVTLGFSF